MFRVLCVHLECLGRDVQVEGRLLARGTLEVLLLLRDAEDVLDVRKVEALRGVGHRAEDEALLVGGHLRAQDERFHRRGVHDRAEASHRCRTLHFFDAHQ